jgi:hypothetical protein
LTDFGGREDACTIENAKSKISRVKIDPAEIQ